MTKEVILHVYDVTNSGSAKTNNTILQINRVFKDAIGLGGIFHSAIQVYGDEEWSFGFCETGSGVFSCPSGKNPMYTYRESVVLGETNFTNYKVNQILRELGREWPGSSYDLLSKNCNHFCDAFSERLGVPKLPGIDPDYEDDALVEAPVAGDYGWGPVDQEVELDGGVPTYGALEYFLLGLSDLCCEQGGCVSCINLGYSHLRFRLDFNPATLDTVYMIPYASAIVTFASAIFHMFLQCNH